MGIQTKASDWHVSAFAQVGGAAGPGGGVYFFKFRSQTAGVNETFVFAGVGGGMGGSVGGCGIPALGGLSYTSLECSREFSVADLDMSMGRIASAGLSGVVGVGVVQAEAFNFGGQMFDDTVSCGFGLGGIGISAFAFCGMWRSVRLSVQGVRRAIRR